LSTIAVVIVSLLGASPADAKVLPIDDFAQRWSPATAVIGKRLFVFGGLAPYNHGRRPKELLFNDGAIVDPSTGDRDIVAQAPFDPPLHNPSAIAVGDKVLVVGTSCNAKEGDEDIICDPATLAAGLYDVNEDSWQTVKMPKALRHFENQFAVPMGTTSDGRAVLRIEGLGDFWTYSPKKDQWAYLPSAGFRAESMCFSDDHLVLLRMKYEEGGVVSDEDPMPNAGGSGKYYVQPSLAILNLGGRGTWRETASDPTPKYDSSPPTISCLNNHVMLVGSIYWFRDLRLYDEATDRWSVPAPAPTPAASGPPSGIFSLHRVSTGTELIVLASEVDVGKSSVAYNPVTNTWREIRGLPPITRHALWNGTAVVGYQEPLGLPQARTKAGVYRFVP
jgi:hypothetical protein